MPSSRVEPTELRERARKLFDRDARSWAVGETDSAVLALPLHPPTERDALGDPSAAVAWVERWREAEASLPVTLSWAERAWARVGRQVVPERATVTGADAIAVVAQASRAWRTWSERVQRLSARLGAAPACDVTASAAALRRHGRAISELAPADFAVLEAVTDWLARHPVSGYRIRQLPIRGIDTKWMERHRVIVESLVTSATREASLGLIDAPERLRMRILDPALRPGGLEDVTAPVTELARLEVAPRVVLIVENLETLLALPEFDGVVAVHGSGYIGHLVAHLPWVHRSRILYWGDLDSHGLAILHRVRSGGIVAESVLMDAETLDEFRDLWVPEPSPFAGTPELLTPAELGVFARLREEGYVRLEQERIAWDWALARLESAVTVDR